MLVYLNNLWLLSLPPLCQLQHYRLPPCPCPYIAQDLEGSL